jgi:hypothetical protein
LGGHSSLAHVAGRLRKDTCFVMARPHSDALFVQAFQEMRSLLS